MDLFDDADSAPLTSKANKLAGFKVDNAFALEYDRKKRLQELAALQDKYGADVNDDDGSETSYSSEDSEAEFATPTVDVAILKTLARIRRGDASIYETGRDIFSEEEKQLAGPSTSNGSKKRKRETPLSLSAYQRQTLLAGGEEAEHTRGRPTPAQEADALRAEVTAAFHQAAASDEEDEDDEDGLLVPRLKTADEAAEDDEAYRAFLKKEAGPDALQLDEGEDFLQDYIVNRGWLDRNSKHIPTHEEILDDSAKPSSKSKKGKERAVEAYQPLQEDDSDFDEKADDFENRYNFRFEEPGAESLTTFTRNVGDSLRRPDTARAEKRKRKAEAKAEKEAKRMSELAEERAEKERLRELQAEAKDERLQRLREAVGAGVQGLDEMDLDADFDPDEHDRKMAAMFNDGFYGAEDVDADGKPTWVDSDEEEHLPYVAPDAEDDDAYDPSAPVTKESKKERKKKRKQQAEQAAADATEAAVDDEDAQKLAYDAYFDRFEYEDLVDNQPTRFHYAAVADAAFDLTPEEILLATDAELNTYVGLSKLATYRQPKNGTTITKRSRRARELRQLLRRRAWGQETARDEIEHAAEVVQRRKAKSVPGTGANAVTVEKDGVPVPIVPKKRRGKKERDRAAKKAAKETGEAGEE